MPWYRVVVVPVLAALAGRPLRTVVTATDDDGVAAERLVDLAGPTMTTVVGAPAPDAVGGWFATFRAHEAAVVAACAEPSYDAVEQALARPRRAGRRRPARCGRDLGGLRAVARGLRPLAPLRLVGWTGATRRTTDHPRRARGGHAPGARAVRRAAARPARAAGQAHVQPLPPAAPPTTGPGLDVSRLRRRHRRRPGGAGPPASGDDDVRAARRRNPRPRGSCPLVVPQLRTITLGGAVTGLGIESTSFRNGLPHESVLEMRGPHRRRRGRHRDPRRRARRPLPRVPQLLRLARLRARPRHRARAGPALRRPAPRALRRPSTRSPTPSRRSCATARWHGEPGRLRRRRRLRPRRGLPDPRPLDRRPRRAARRRTRPATTPGQQVFYRSIRERTHDVLTAHDYLWRWDTDWFWCTRAFGAQNPVVRRLWPRSKLLRSDVYWKIVGLREPAPGHGAARRAPGPARRGSASCRTSRSRSSARPSSSTGSCARCRSSRSGCARCSCGHGPTASPPDGRRRRAVAALPDAARASATSTSASGRRCRSRPGAGRRRRQPRHRGRGDAARRAQVALLRRLLRRGDLRRLYGGATYRLVKQRYDPRGRLPTLYEKAVQAR